MYLYERISRPVVVQVFRRISPQNHGYCCFAIHSFAEYKYSMKFCFAISMQLSFCVLSWSDNERAWYLCVYL